MLASSLSSQAGIQYIPQTVSEQIQGKNRKHDRQSGERDYGPEVTDIYPAGREHGAPLRRGRLNAQPNKAQRRSGQNGGRYAQSGLDDNGRERIGQDLADDDV